MPEGKRKIGIFSLVLLPLHHSPLHHSLLHFPTFQVHQNKKKYQLKEKVTTLRHRTYLNYRNFVTKSSWERWKSGDIQTPNLVILGKYPSLSSYMLYSSNTLFSHKMNRCSFACNKTSCCNHIYVCLIIKKQV